MDSGDCPICAKHRGEGPLMGPLVWEDEHCLVFHAPVGEDSTVFLGYLFIETRRHLPYSDWPGAPRGGTPAITELCKRF